MKLQPISAIKTQQNRQSPKRLASVNAPYTTNTGFTGLMPDNIKNALKLCVFDLDETLLEGPQATRDKVMAFAKEKNKFLVYSSARPLNKVQPLIDDNTLIMPDYCVCNNGANIYKNINGKLEEITYWSDGLANKFNKNKVRKIVLELARNNMFTQEEWAPFSSIATPKDLKPFEGSKVSEYIAFASPLNIRFYLMPEVYEKNINKLKKQLADSNIEADISLQTYGAEELVPGFLEKYFTPKIAENIRAIAIPRTYENGKHDALVISASTNKGKATEFIRKELGLKKKQIFASGDAENDFSHTNKGYFFAFLSNATEGLKKMVANNSNKNIINASKPGVSGIWEVVEP